MKQETKSTFRQAYENTKFVVSEELTETMKTPIYQEKIAKAKEIVQKLDLEKIKRMSK